MVANGNSGRKEIKVCSQTYGANKTIPFLLPGNYVFPEECKGRKVPQVTDSVFDSEFKPCTSNFQCSAILAKGACCAHV